MLAWLVVVVTVLVLVGLGVLLARQGSPGALSEQPGSDRSRQQPNVVGRPAGADAEPMGVDEPGEATIRSEAGGEGRGNGDQGAVADDRRREGP